MEKPDLQSFRARAGLLIDQSHALIRHFLQRAVDVVDGKSQVVQAGAAFFDELPDRPVGVGRFEQFDLGLADLSEGRSDLLVGDFLDGITLQSKYVLVVSDGLGEVFHRDADMLDV